MRVISWVLHTWLCGVAVAYSSNYPATFQRSVPRRPSCFTVNANSFRSAGPTTERPLYADASLIDRLGIDLFRKAMAKNLGHDVETPGFAGILELARSLNKIHKPAEVQVEVRYILRSLFPELILRLFPLMFSVPFPEFSAKLNARITRITCAWLMGKMQLEDVPNEEVTAGWGDGRNQGLKIERCRFLEESGCASICINTCKVPTQVTQTTLIPFE